MTNLSFLVSKIVFQWFITYIEGIPNDGIPTEEVVIVSVALTVIYVILATAGLVFAVGCLLFNILFREKRYHRIKLM